MKVPLFVNHFGKLIAFNCCQGIEIRFEDYDVKVSEFNTIEIIYNGLKNHGEDVCLSFNSKFLNDEKWWVLLALKIFNNKFSTFYRY